MDYIRAIDMNNTIISFLGGKKCQTLMKIRVCLYISAGDDCLKKRIPSPSGKSVRLLPVRKASRMPN